MNKKYKLILLLLQFIFLIGFLAINGIIYRLGIQFAETHPEITRYEIEYHDVHPTAIYMGDDQIDIYTGNFSSFFYFYSRNAYGTEAEFFRYHRPLMTDYIALNRKTDGLYQGLVVFSAILFALNLGVLVYVILKREQLYGYLIAIVSPLLVALGFGMLNYWIIAITVLTLLGALLIYRSNRVEEQKNYILPFLTKKRQTYLFNAEYDQKKKS